MQWRSLAIFIGLGLLAVTQFSEGRHSMRNRRETDYDFAADEASEDETQNDFEGSPEPQNEPPIQAKITTPGKVYEVESGRDVSLECHIDPEDAPVVTQWYKNNETYFMNTIKMANDIDLTRYFVGKDRSLNIQAVEPLDAGAYRCEVIQANTVTVEHTLLVPFPPMITRYIATNDGNVMEGQDLLLTCDVQGSPPPQIMWSRILVNHNENERLSEVDGEFSPNSFYMRGVKRDHSGKYYCYACNGPNRCDQREISIDITGKPHVRVHKTVINSAIGVEALLECSTRYDANPHIRWYKDGNLIEDSSTDYVITTHKTRSNLTVTPKEDKDFGTFTCEAENSMGRHNRSISLVQRPVLETLRAEDGRLTWTVHSHSPLQKLQAQLQFTRGDGNNTFYEFDIPLPSTPGHSYELIFDLKDKQLEAGKYQAVVKAENEHGKSEDIDPVIVEIDSQPIQVASVFRGNSAHSIQASVILPTILMYLLVRTL